MSGKNHNRRLEKVLFFFLLFSFAYFYQGGGANQNARLDQARSIVEYAQLNLKGRASSHDIVQVGNRTYPNKAPGVSLMSTFPFFVASSLEPVVEMVLDSRYFYLFVSYFVTLSIAGFFCALGGVFFYRLLGFFDPSPGPRLLAVLALYLGTPAFAYATMLYGHMVASSLTIISFYLLYRALVAEPDRPRRVLSIFAAGLIGGWAVVTEYPAAAIVGVLALYCFSRSHRRRRLRRIAALRAQGRRCAGLKGWVSPPAWLPVLGEIGIFLLGILLPAAVLLGYNRAIFGDWFYFAYFDKRAAAHASYRRGWLMGFAFNLRKCLHVAWYTSFGSYRGFFHLAPVLVLAFPGTWYLCRRRGGKPLALFLWVLLAGYFIANTTYPHPEGGKALGPRHAMEILPYLVLLGFFFIRRFRRLSGILVVVSIFLMLVAVSTRPEEYVRRPFQDLYFEAFFDGALSIRGEPSFVNAGPFNSFNLGQVFGLAGRLSLLPLYVFWFIGGCVMFTLTSRSSGRERSPASLSGPLLALLVLLVALQGFTLYRLFQVEQTVEELTDTGEYRVPPGQVPVSQVLEKGTTGHRLQVWEVRKPFQPGDAVTVMAQHAASGREGGFNIIAFADRNGDGVPDVEVSRSPYLTGRRGGDWSRWIFPAPSGRLFVGTTWREGSRVYFSRTPWQEGGFSPKMFYSTDGSTPVRSASPRSSNLAVLVSPGEGS